MTGHSTTDTPPPANESDTRALVAALDSPFAFGHPVRYVRLVETHISWIILTGNYAYKIKKPVNFGFLDFSTLDKRRFYCEEELRLNRRFAPQIYLELVEICGSRDKPKLGGSGEVLDYAIRMLEFPQQNLLSNLAAQRQLDNDMIDDIASTVAEMHGASETATAESNFGNAEVVALWSDENLVHIADAITTEYLPNSYFELKRWYRENRSLLAVIDQRKQDGFVRECHGDLHLGNMTLLQGKVTLFDCIEFNPELRWIDTISEAAFVAMDLHARGFPGMCWRFLNRYLESSGDYGGVALLRYYFVYRALVRAKVEALRIDQQACSASAYPEHIKPALAYIELANRWAGSHRAGLILMHGLSGSGKSTVAEQLVESLGAIRIRSDVIRKELFDFKAQARTGSALAEGIYSDDASQLTYQRLSELAARIIDADFTVIVDAAFLLEAQRRVLLEMETGLPCNRIIVHCEAPEEELRRRIAERENDPSEANLQVLEHQLQSRQPVGADEESFAGVVTIGECGIGNAEIRQIRELLAN